MPDQCVAIKASGERCEVDWALNENGECAAHDPARREARMVGVTKSIETRQAKAEQRRNGTPAGMPTDGPPVTLADAVAWAGWVAHATATGEMDTKRADSINKNLSVLVHAIDKKELEGELHRVKSELKRITSGKSR